MNRYKQFIIIWLFVLFSLAEISKGSAQGLYVGYKYGVYTTGLRELQAELYQYNKMRPTITEPYDFNNFNYGLSFGFESIVEDQYIFGGFSNRHQIFHAKGIDPFGLDKIPTDFYTKARLNVLEIGAGVVEENIIFGFSFDVGGFGYYLKSIPVGYTGIEEIEYKRKGNNALFIGSTFFLDFCPHADFAALHFRVYYQFPWGAIMRETVLDAMPFNHFYRVNNLGLACILAFGNLNED